MKFLRQRRALLEDLENRLQQSLAKIPDSAEKIGGGSPLESIAVTAAWILGGLGVVTLGLMAGRELRGRYMLKRRTPYDYYAHSGDRSPEFDYSVGV